MGRRPYQWGACRWNEKAMKLTIYLRLLIVFGFSMLCACVVIPYTPDTEITRLKGKVPAPSAVKLTIGPRLFLKEMGEKLVSRDKRIQIVPGLEFRDTVFPAGNWTLSTLLSSKTRERVQATQTDYLVAFGPMQYEEDESGDLMLVGIGFWGIANIEGQADISTVVVDLEKTCVVNLLLAECEASWRGIGWFFGIFIAPRHERSIEEELADELVRILKAERPEGAIRIVLMAAESADFESPPLYRK